MAYCLPPCGIHRLEVSQISIQLMRVKSLSTEAEAAFEQGGTTDTSLLSMQLLETTQEKMPNMPKCPIYLPLPGFLPFIPCCIKVLPFPFKISSLGHLFTKETGLFSKDSSRSYPFKWHFVPQAMFNVITWWLKHYPGSGNLGSRSFSALGCPNMWAIKNWPERLNAQMRVLSRHRPTIALFLYTNLFIFVLLQLISSFKEKLFLSKPAWGLPDHNNWTFLKQWFDARGSLRKK